MHTCPQVGHAPRHRDGRGTLLERGRSRDLRGGSWRDWMCIHLMSGMMPCHVLNLVVVCSCAASDILGPVCPGIDLISWPSAVLP